VVFLDADDQILPDAVATGVRTLTTRPAAVCAVGRAQPMDADGRDLPSRPPRPAISEVYREWLYENFVFTPGAAIFRRPVLDALRGFRTDVGPAADYAMYLELARHDRIVDHGQVVVRYRSHSGSMSQSHSRMLRATMRVLREEQAHVPPEFADDLRRGRARWARWYGEQIIEWALDDRRARGLRLTHARAMAMLVRHCPGLLLARVRSRVTRAILPERTARSRKTE
jgi:hypothetical protein